MAGPLSRSLLAAIGAAIGLGLTPAVAGAASVRGLRGSKLLVEGRHGLRRKPQAQDEFGAALSNRSSTGLFD